MNQDLQQFEVCVTCNKAKKQTHWKCKYEQDVGDAKRSMKRRIFLAGKIRKLEQDVGDTERLKKRKSFLAGKIRNLEHHNNEKDGMLQNIIREHDKYHKKSKRICKDSLHKNIMIAKEYYKRE